MTDTTTLTRERADLIESLRPAPAFLRFTVQGLTDEQATAAADRERAQPGRPDQARGGDRGGLDALRRGRRRGDAPQLGPRRAGAGTGTCGPGETLAGVLADYEEVAAAHRRPRRHAARPRRRPPAAGGAVVRARRALVGPPGAPARHRRDRPSTPGTPTSCGSRSTARRRWDDPPISGRQPESSRTAATTRSSAARLCPLTKASQYGSAAAMPPTSGR